MVKAKKWVLAKHFEGMPKESDFRLEEEELNTELKEGEFYCEAEFLSVDPYIRLFGSSLPLNAPVMGEQVAKVLESKHKDHPVGSYVVVKSGWRTHTVYRESEVSELRALPDVGKLPRSMALGYMGMTGETAYFGFEEICQAKKGDIVYITGAAGAVGSVVGQLAKIKGCTVIGSASTEEKLKYLRDLGFDHVFNYKTRETGDALKEFAPKGVDVFYDNIGGPVSTVVLEHMSMRGRMAVGGVSSGYNDKDGAGSEQTGKLPYTAILMNQLRVEAFHLWRFYDRRPEADAAIRGYIEQGKLKYHEILVDGFDKMPAAFIDVLQGKTFGKTIIKI